MAKSKLVEESDDEGMVISGHAIVTLNVKVELHTDECDYGVPDICQHKHRVVLPDPCVGKSMNPDRFMSAGFAFGVELARIANHFRDAIADSAEIAAGFAREMRDWDKDHNVKGGK